MYCSFDFYFGLRQVKVVLHHSGRLQEPSALLPIGTGVPLEKTKRHRSGLILFLKPGFSSE
jgi:hypothetical protein